MYEEREDRLKELSLGVFVMHPGPLERGSLEDGDYIELASL